jgi:hypothetical protein
MVWVVILTGTWNIKISVESFHDSILEIDEIFRLQYALLGYTAASCQTDFDGPAEYGLYRTCLRRTPDLLTLSCAQCFCQDCLKRFTEAQFSTGVSSIRCPLCCRFLPPPDLERACPCLVPPLSVDMVTIRLLNKVVMVTSRVCSADS